MVVLEAGAINSSLLGGPYGQGPPALKIVQKRYLGLHQWLSPIATKDLKEQIVSAILFVFFFCLWYLNYWIVFIYALNK